MRLDPLASSVEVTRAEGKFGSNLPGNDGVLDPSLAELGGRSTGQHIVDVSLDCGDKLLIALLASEDPVDPRPKILGIGILLFERQLHELASRIPPAFKHIEEHATPASQLMMRDALYCGSGR